MIGWYIHHHGHGHLHRAVSIAAHLSEPVVALSSLPRPARWAGEWIELPRDDHPDSTSADPTAGGTLHWAPPHHDGLRERMSHISTVLARPDLRLVVVDVSVEVANLVTLYGIPLVVVAQPGDRTDRPHRMAYDMAHAILAPYPNPGHADEPTAWPKPWIAKTTAVGGISRFDGLAAPPPPGKQQVLVIWGAGGTDVGPIQLSEAAASTPDWRWRVLGAIPPGTLQTQNLTWFGWNDTVWEHLCRSDVVITHAGLNSVAEVAAARRPAIVIAQARPHSEQLATVRALTKLSMSTALQRWPATSHWAQLLTRAHSGGTDHWTRWSTGHGAAAAAHLLQDIAQR